MTIQPQQNQKWRFSPLAGSRRKSRLACSGWSIAELTVTSLIMSMLLTGVLALVGGVTRVSAKHSTESTLTGDNRLAMDEMLAHLRSAQTVLSGNQTVAGRTYATSASQVVLRTPAYNPNDPQVISDTATDLVAFRFQPGSNGAPGALYQSIQPGTGSVRPSRNELLLARNVSSVNFAYHVREQAKAAATGVFALTLSATPVTDTPVVYVNGVRSSAAVTRTGLRLATVPAVTKNDDVQVVYTVNPVTEPASAAFISEVDVTTVLTQRDGANITRQQTLQGGACLRNQRN